MTNSILQYKKYSTSNIDSSHKLNVQDITFAKSQNNEDTESCLPCITDPLVIYRSYVSRGILQPDINQLRCMVEFQKLYDELKDYQPDSLNDILINEYINKLKEYTKQLDESIPLNTVDDNDTSKTELNQGLFKNLNLSINQIINKNKFKKNERIKNELIKILTDEEKFNENINSPKGLIINGTVGSGKSLLMDIFANSLPIKSKRRWHYNNFILWVYSEIHNLQLKQTEKKFLNFKKFQDYKNGENIIHMHDHNNEKDKEIETFELIEDVDSLNDFFQDKSIGTSRILIETDREMPMVLCVTHEYNSCKINKDEGIHKSDSISDTIHSDEDEDHSPVQVKYIKINLEQMVDYLVNISASPSVPSSSSSSSSPSD
ncbi:hypothetical protein B5S31_g5002 [[Candida] boidinii]|nr:hypothetical protein B5S31_g5002 [[Candida] boidinii]